MAAIDDRESPDIVAKPEQLIRSRSGALIASMTFATLATGLLQICLPLELRQLRASPNEIGVSLSRYGFGMFAFEWLWGVLADRAGYRAPLVVSQLLYAACIVLLSRVDSIVLIAASYFLASRMMGAIGPIARSYVGTAMQSRLRATGLALLAASWVVSEALGAGAGGQLIDRFPIRSVILAAAVLPLGSALPALWFFQGLPPRQPRRPGTCRRGAARGGAARRGRSAADPGGDRVPGPSDP